jgi:hypothetical protein
LKSPVLPDHRVAIYERTHPFNNEVTQYAVTYLRTYFMELSPSCEANRFLASQEIPRILWNPKVVTVHSGPCEEDGSIMWGRVFYRGRDPMSKGALDTGGRKVIKKNKNQTIALAVGMQRHRVGWAVEILHSEPPGVAVHTRWFISAVHQIYLVINYTIIEVTLFCSDCSNYRYKPLYSYSCTYTT